MNTIYKQKGPLLSKKPFLNYPKKSLTIPQSLLLLSPQTYLLDSGSSKYHSYYHNPSSLQYSLVASNVPAASALASTALVASTALASNVLASTPSAANNYQNPSSIYPRNSPDDNSPAQKTRLSSIHCSLHNLKLYFLLKLKTILYLILTFP